MRITAIILTTLLTLVYAQNITWYDAQRDTFYISTAEQLKGLSVLVSDGTNGTSNFNRKTIILANDIFLSGNFAPIGNGSTRTFNGTFDGQGYTISGLSVSDAEYAGLFGYVGSNGQIKNVKIIAAKIKGKTAAGGLVAYYTSSKSIENCSATADSVTSSGYSGGLIGYGGSTTIINSYATGNVSGSYSGGLVGYGSSSGSIEYSYATGNVSGSNYSGGLVGYGSGLIEYSYATGNVSNKYSSNSYSGGLMGYGNNAIYIINSYATGNISDTTTATSNSYYSHSGGLVGYAGATITISNSYARGNISAYATSSSNSTAGGLVGYANSTIAISNSYASGNISAINAGTGYNYSGGILGFYNSNDFLYKSAYYNFNGANKAVGSGISTGISGLSSEGLKQRMNFNDWNFDYTWNINEGVSYPYLVDKSRGATLSVPILASKTHNSITINPVIASTGQVVEYTITTNIAVVAGNIVPADITEWETTLTFTNLSPYTNYYIFARTKENASYNAGKISTYLFVQTDAESNSDNSSSSSLDNNSSSSEDNNSSSRLENSSSSSEDISQIYPFQLIASNSAIAINNAINLQVKKSARLEIYNLNGKLERTLNFANGVYKVPLNNLPKGLYVVKVKFENSGREIVKIPIK
jgi:hypothetical protein